MHYMNKKEVIFADVLDDGCISLCTRMKLLIWKKYGKKYVYENGTKSREDGRYVVSRSRCNRAKAAGGSGAL